MRLVSWSIPASLLLSANPLLAGLASAYQDATHLYLENDVLKIAVLRTTGSLDGIVHKQSGVNLQSNNVSNREAIWAMGLSTPSVFFMTNRNTRSFTGTVATTTTEASLSLTWKGLFPSGVSLPNVTVKARISVRADSEFSYWTINVDGLGTSVISDITYPYVTGVGQLGQSGENDAVLLPQHKGMLYHNPTANLKSAGASYPGRNPYVRYIAEVGSQE